MRIIVYHGGYGCETGCCGHWFEVDDDSPEFFTFDHPDSGEDHRAFAEAAITERFGADHVANLDWENSRIVYD